ncbi:MAG: DNA alkylation repair protein [Streptosporangiaceae bacterium]
MTSPDADATAGATADADATAGAGADVGAAADAARIQRQLLAAGSPGRAASEQNYLKSTLDFSGTTVPAARNIVTTWRREHPGLTRERVTHVAAALWDGPFFECRMAAVILLTDRRALLTAADLPLIERMLRAAGTWALVDGLAADVLGGLTERFPAQLHPVLDRFAADDDFWIRRSALLALLVPLRRGEPGGFERFAGYADAMLSEREFFIRKAIGWVLRETGKRQPDLVAGWLAPRLHRASGVTVREAVKWLPARQREELLAAYRSRKAG